VHKLQATIEELTTAKDDLAAHASTSGVDPSSGPRLAILPSPPTEVDGG
jgi:hypothetical protein